MILSSLAAAAALVQPLAEVPFRVAEDAIIVEAQVNGRKLALMVDTGFGGAVSVDSVVNIGKPTGTMNLKDFVGTFQAQSVKVQSLRIGGYAVPPGDMEAMLAPGERYSSFSYNTHVDGILGLEPFKAGPFEINFQNRKFVFYPKSFDVTQRVPDGKRTFLAKMLPIGHSSIELSVEAPSGKRLVMALDTGNSFYATTHKDVLERVGLWPQGRKPKFVRTVGVASGPVDSWVKRMTGMRIFGVEVPESYWDVIDLPASSAESDGTIGFQFLRNFNILVDYERRRVWLENFTGKVSEPPVADVGIVLRADQAANRLRVARVLAGSPADRAGVKENDQLLAIDGRSYFANVGFRQLRLLTQGPAGSKVRLAFSRGGQLIQLDLEREPLYND
jgi:predicted aspartyl protease